MPRSSPPFPLQRYPWRWCRKCLSLRLFLQTSTKFGHPCGWTRKEFVYSQTSLESGGFGGGGYASTCWSIASKETHRVHCRGFTACKVFGKQHTVKTKKLSCTSRTSVSPTRAERAAMNGYQTERPRSSFTFRTLPTITTISKYLLKQKNRQHFEGARKHPPGRSKPREPRNPAT